MANPNPTPRPENIAPYQIKPGEVRNPAGYSRGRRAVDDLLDLIADRKADRAISTRWLQSILEGDFQFLKEYLERRDGKVAQKIDLETLTDEAAVDEHGNAIEP